MHYYHLKYVKVTLNIYFFKDIDVRMMYCVEIEVILLYIIIIILICEHTLHPPRTAFPGLWPGKAVQGGCRVCSQINN